MFPWDLSYLLFVKETDVTNVLFLDINVNNDTIKSYVTNIYNYTSFKFRAIAQ